MRTGEIDSMSWSPVMMGPCFSAMYDSSGLTYCSLVVLEEPASQHSFSYLSVPPVESPNVELQKVLSIPNAAPSTSKSCGS
jgi:hypothetical protein